MEEEQKRLYDNLVRQIKKRGEKVFSSRDISDKERIKRTRESWISCARYFENGPYFEKDCKYVLKACEAMSNKQILMSYKREEKLSREEVDKFMVDIERFERDAKKSKLMVMAGVA